MMATVQVFSRFAYQRCCFPELILDFTLEVSLDYNVVAFVLFAHVRCMFWVRASCHHALSIV